VGEFDHEDGSGKGEDNGRGESGGGIMSSKERKSTIYLEWLFRGGIIKRGGVGNCVGVSH